MHKISIIIPAYNEEKTILQILKKVSEQKIDDIQFETLVVNDGSSDNTLEILNQNPHLYTKLVNMKKNSGKGAAVREGIRNATGEYILFQDADLEYDPVEYKNMVFPVKNFNADIIMGSRFLAAHHTRIAYFWHKVGNRIISFLFNILNNTTFTDIYSCYLMYKRELIKPDELKTDGWQQQAEILGLAVKRSKVYYEVAIAYHGRTYEDGKKIRAHHIISVIQSIFWTKFFRK